MTSTQIGHLDVAAARARLQPTSSRAQPIRADEYGARIERARRLMRTQQVDALLITAGPSMRYFTGVPWRATERLVSLLLTENDDPIVVCPGFERPSLDAELSVPSDLRLWEEHEDPYALVVQAMSERGARTLALDPGAAFATYSGLSPHMGTNAIVDAAAIVDGCRMCKSPVELALMQQACDMTLEVLRMAAAVVAEGMGSDSLVDFIDFAHRQLGADDGSTFCIVQFGAATAYPHGIPGVQYLREGDLVLIDTGCTVQGYHSDITRTFIYGRPSQAQRRIWEIERAAQAAAFAAVGPGVTCEAIDAVARSVLEEAGLGPGYQLPGLPHRTGHGCGLAIHEAPYLVRGNDLPLRPGMCASNEPMIVVPGAFGVRLEDHFHVTEEGACWFTAPSPAIDRPFA